MVQWVYSKWEPIPKGTIAVCEALANLPDANTIIGGGDSAAAVMKLGTLIKYLIFQLVVEFH